MSLIAEQAAYSLTIDSQLPIDTLLLTSKQSIDVLEIVDNVAKENTVPDDQGQMIKTFKFSAIDLKKITIKFRAAEGLQQGNLNFFVIP
jgi:hypothetical protein